MSQISKLFDPIKIGNVSLKNRIVMAPLTRYRANEAHVHGDLAVEYYSQRGSTPGTLLVTEATFISEYAGGYDHVPGIYTDEQIAGWKKVTDAVHKNGSFIFVQLWALGRAAEAEVLKRDGYDLVSSSDIPMTGGSKPRPLTTAEIQTYVKEYATAAQNAILAGFDGVEIHGANGYLLDQFLQSVSNDRTDEYGGSVANRIRIVQEVLRSVTAAVGEERTAIRLSPWSRYQDMKMDDPKPTFTALVEHLVSTYPKLAYLSVVEPRILGSIEESPSDVQQSAGAEEDSNTFIANLWLPRPLLLGGGFSHAPGRAKDVVNQEGVLAVFGRAFLANPDLPLRLKNDIPLNSYNRDTFYLPGAEPKGYTDYPFALMN